jgi:uncharacterized protein (DUF58 family)
MKNNILFFILLILGLFFAGLISRNGDIVWMALLFIVYLGIGIAQSPVQEEIKLKARRQVNKQRQEDSSFLIEVEVVVRNEGRKSLCILLSDPIRKDMEVTKGSLYLMTSLKPGEEAVLGYSFKITRGDFSWKCVSAKVADPLCLQSIQIEIEAETELFIHPHHRRFHPFPIRPWETLSSPGLIPTRQGGSGTEFWGVREYHPGDPLKYLDWRLTARHPHQFFTREFVQEKTADIALIIDGRQSMNISTGKENLFEQEIKTAASLAETFLWQGHRVGMSIIGNSYSKIQPDYGKKQLHRILNFLATVKIESDDGKDPLIHFSTRQFSSKTMVIVISPMNSNDSLFYRRLRFQRLQTILICPDTLEFIKPAANRETVLALRTCRLERKRNLNLISQLSISVIDWKIHEPLAPLLRRALARPLVARKI